MPLERSWNALTKAPWMVVFPLVWDLGVWLAIQFAVGPAPQADRKVMVKFLLPPALPSGTELFDGRTLTNVPGGFLTIVIVTVLSALVKAGYLHVMAGALQDEGTGWARFIEGIKYFGGRMLVWHLVLAGVMVLAMLVAAPMQGAAVLLIIPGILAAMAYYLTDFLIVARDMEIGDALRAAPGMLAANFGVLLPVGLASVIASVVISLGLSVTGLQTAWAAAPLWSWFGTWTGMAVISVLSEPVPVIE